MTVSKSKHASQTRFERARRKAQRRKPTQRRSSDHYNVIRIAIKEA